MIYHDTLFVSPPDTTPPVPVDQVVAKSKSTFASQRLRGVVLVSVGVVSFVALFATLFYLYLHAPEPSNIEDGVVERTTVLVEQRVNYSWSIIIPIAAVVIVLIGLLSYYSRNLKNLKRRNEIIADKSKRLLTHQFLLDTLETRLVDTASLDAETATKMTKDDRREMVESAHDLFRRLFATFDDNPFKDFLEECSIKKRPPSLKMTLVLHDNNTWTAILPFRKPEQGKKVTFTLTDAFWEKVKRTDDPADKDYINDECLCALIEGLRELLPMSTMIVDDDEDLKL